MEDANDEKPQFLERTAEGNLEISLPEGNYTQVPPPGQRVAEIRVKDNDERVDFRRVSETLSYKMHDTHYDFVIVFAFTH